MTSIPNLSTSQTLLLFTPVITLAGADKASTKSAPQIDPFESLGRALSRHHRRIRHVPYVPKIGFTETHDAFLSQADLTIVVLCEPESAKHESIGNQVDFAEAALDSHEGGASRQPLIVVRCGSSKEGVWPHLSQFDHLLKCKAYDGEMAQQIARKLFDSRN